MRYFRFPNVPVDTTGIASDANQIITNAKLDTVISNTTGLATQATLVSTNTKLDSIITNTTDGSTATLQAATNTKLDTVIVNTTDGSTATLQTSTNTKLDTLISNTANTLASLDLGVVDQLDSILLNASSTAIPSSAADSLVIVSSLAADVKKMLVIDDIGEYMALFSGLITAPVLLCVLPLGGGEVTVKIPAATQISIRHLRNTSINLGSLAINFLG